MHSAVHPNSPEVPRRSFLKAFVVLAVSAIASASGAETSLPGNSKLGVFDLGRDDGRTVRRLIDTGRLPIYRTTVEKANELVPYYKQRNPGGLVMIGLGGGMAAEYTGDAASFAMARWKSYLQPELERIRPEVRNLVDYFAVANNLSEPHSVPQAEWWSEYAKALCALCQKSGIRPLILSSGVGCLPCVDESQLRVLEAMLPGLRAALACQGGWSCGAFSVDYTMDPQVESKYSLRYRRAYDFFRRKAPDLMALPMILSEVGIDRSGDPNLDGYAARGSAEKFSQWIVWFDSEIKKDSCIRGGALFAIGTGGGWKSFDLDVMVPWLSAYWNRRARESVPGTNYLLFAAEGMRKIVILARDGSIQWEYPAEMSRDAWRLPNGNILFCYNNEYDSRRNDNPSGVLEVTPDKRIMFHFRTTGQVWSCQRMSDGNTLVGAASQGKLLIVGPDGTLVRSIQLRGAPGHSCLRNARQIEGGHFLVAEEGSRAVREYASDGALVREIQVDFPPYSAVRLANGNTLACGQTKMVEVDENGRVVWTLNAADIPEMGVRWFAGIQVLPNGNVLVCNAGGKVPFLEVNRQKQITWQWPSSAPAIPLGHGIQRLDIEGSLLK